MSRLLAKVSNINGRVTITYFRGPTVGEEDIVEPGYAVLLYSTGCLIPILIIALVAAVLL
jgi:hypothetical protein